MENVSVALKVPRSVVGSLTEAQSANPNLYVCVCVSVLRNKESITTKKIFKIF